jgi:hypothetical protein
MDRCDIGGTLKLGDGTHRANIALLNNYIASEFLDRERRPWWHG